MEMPLQITFRDMEASPAIEANIRKRAARLERFSHYVVACHVTVESPHRHQHQGKQFRVRVELAVPGGELTVSRAPSMRQENEDAHVAVRDAFDAAVRRLEDHVRRQRGETKSHDTPPHGRVARLVPEEDHGFIATADGREVFFHRNSVLGGGFERLQPGTEVRFVEEEGDKGPQASTVRLVGKHHPVG